MADKYAEAEKGPNRLWLEDHAARTFEESEGNFGTRDWHDENGIEWWAMGWNATHYFYLGVNAEDQLFRKSAWLEKDGPKEHITGPLTPKDIGYLGHW